jgi:DNA-binding FadR family transcriptional regulator
LDTFLPQPANRAYSITDEVFEQIGNAILSGCSKPGDKIISEKELKDEFSGSEESLTSISIVRSENLIKGKEI